MPKGKFLDIQRPHFQWHQMRQNVVRIKITVSTSDRSNEADMTLKDSGEMEAKDFGQRLRRLRIARGFTKARHIATKLGVNENTYSRYERGLNVPSLQLLKLICVTLDASIYDLLPYRGKSQSTPSSLVVPATSGDCVVLEGPRQACATVGELRLDSQNCQAQPRPMCNLYLECSMSAWAVAEVAAKLPAGNLSTHNERVSSLAIAASIYLKLKSDPFGTISLIVEDLKVSGADAEVWERISRSVDQFAASYRTYRGSLRELEND